MGIRQLTMSIGLAVLALGVLGIFVGEATLEGAINVDRMIDITRIILGGFLLGGSLKSEENAKTMLGVFGVAYMSLFIIGLSSPKVFGILPHGLGWLDQLIHFTVGTATMILATGKDILTPHPPKP